MDIIGAIGQLKLYISRQWGIYQGGIHTDLENALPPKSKLAKATKGYIYKVQTKNEIKY